MNKINLFLIMFVIAILLSIGAISQLSPIAKTITKTSQITPTISLEEKNTCTTTFYNEVQDVYGTCIYHHNYTSCLNTSGPDTDCSLEQDTWDFTCKTGETISKNRTTCVPNSEYLISIDQGAATLKKQIDFSDWGPCVYEQENSCLVVTCVSLIDGAHNGQFTDCSGGKSCQKFEICDDGVKSWYKNSREDFVENDPSFYLGKLAVAEVEE